MIRHYLQYTIILLTFVFIAATAAASGPFKATATLDSTILIQGGKSHLNVEFVGPLTAQSHIEVIDSMWHEVEITHANDEDEETDLGNGRKSIRRTYIVQAFDSGLYTLPPIYCISGTDTFPTNQPVLKVEPMPLDSANVVMENGQPVDLVINDFTDVRDADYKLLDFLPGWASDYGWWILAAIILLAAIAFVYLKWLRYGKVPQILVRKPIPPYDLAKQSLKALREEALWQKGADKEYYTRLTDILRTYLQGRFGINAMEMTSRQIYDALSANEETRKVRNIANDLMREADFVKFAQNRPDAHENEEAFRWADTIIENTKPVEVKPEESIESKSKATAHISESAQLENKAEES